MQRVTLLLLFVTSYAKSRSYRLQHISQWMCSPWEMSPPPHMLRVCVFAVFRVCVFAVCTMWLVQPVIPLFSFGCSCSLLRRGIFRMKFSAPAGLSANECYDCIPGISGSDILCRKPVNTSSCSGDCLTISYKVCDVYSSIIVSRQFIISSSSSI